MAGRAKGLVFKSYLDLICAHACFKLRCAEAIHQTHSSPLEYVLDTQTKNEMRELVRRFALSKHDYHAVIVVVWGLRVKDHEANDNVSPSFYTQHTEADE